MLETSPWADEFVFTKGMLLQIKIRSINEEWDELEKKHGFRRETVKVKGIEQSFLRCSVPENDAEADEQDACLGEKVKL